MGRSRPQASWLRRRSRSRLVEYGFSSTTVDRAQALHYASGKASTVFEMEMGMIDRGADLTWCSPNPNPNQGAGQILFEMEMGMIDRGADLTWC